MALSSSDSDLSSDWALITNFEESLTNDDSNHNLSVESSTKKLGNDGSKVEEIVQEQELPVLNDSSSSDIDIIDENFDDNPSGFVQPPLTLSLNTSLASSTVEVSESSGTAGTENSGTAALESRVIGNSESSITTTSESSITTTSESSITATSESSITTTSEKNVDEIFEHNAIENSKQNLAGITSNDNVVIDHPPSSGTKTVKWCMDQFIENPSLSYIKAVKTVIGAFLVTFVLHFCFAGNMHIGRIAKENERIIGQMKELLQELQFENRDLKNQVISEIQNEKLFSIFASQVKELKNENLKLTETLQDVILELQKQSSIHDKEMEQKQFESQSLYKNEINKLKEQINILKFDNEELQKQLVRMRYGSYASEMQNDKNEAIDENGTKEDSEKNEENSSGILTDEVKELKRDLQEEVAKLKKWNELVELLVDNLHHSSKNSESDKLFEEKRSHKDQLWSWKDFKKSVKGTLDEFPDMFTKYMNYNRKRIEGAFRSVRHYFKAAREETQKILDSNRFDIDKENIVRKDIWKTLEALGEKWSELGDKWYNFFKTNGEDRKRSQEKNFDTSEFSKSYFESSDKNKKESIKLGKYKHHESIIPSEMPTFSQGEYHSKLHNQFVKNGKSNWYFKKTNEKKYHGKDHKNEDVAESNSWMFERAAYRAEVRQNDEDSPINWYLRKKKENNYDEFFQMPEQAHEEDKTEDLRSENRIKQTNDGRKN